MVSNMAVSIPALTSFSGCCRVACGVTYGIIINPQLRIVNGDYLILRILYEISNSFYIGVVLLECGIFCAKTSNTIALKRE